MFPVNTSGNTFTSNQTNSNVLGSTGVLNNANLAFSNNTQGVGSGTLFNPPSGSFFPSNQSLSSGSSLFSSNRPAVGQNIGTNVQQNSLFGMQSNQANSGGSIFGNTNANLQAKSAPLFGNTNIGSGLFNQQPLQTGASLFNMGQNQSTNVFGNNTISTNLLGTSQSITGTKNIKWREELNRDILGKVQCITYLSEVDQKKSIEELRLEDYCLGTHTNTSTLNSMALQSTQIIPSNTLESNSFNANNTSGIFGTGQNQQAKSVFNTSSAVPSFGSGTSIFGQSSNTAFGGTGITGNVQSNDFNQPQNRIFGTTVAPTNNAFSSQNNSSIFGNNLLNSQREPVLQNSVSGTSSLPLFGNSNTGNLFGQTQNITSSNPFDTTLTSNSLTSSLNPLILSNQSNQVGQSSDNAFNCSNVSSGFNFFNNANTPKPGLFSNSPGLNTLPTSASNVTASNTSSGLFNSNLTPSLMNTNMSNSSNNIATGTNSFLGTSNIPTTTAFGGDNSFQFGKSNNTGSFGNTFGSDPNFISKNATSNISSLFPQNSSNNLNFSQNLQPSLNQSHGFTRNVSNSESTNLQSGNNTLKDNLGLGSTNFLGSNVTSNTKPFGQGLVNNSSFPTSSFNNANDPFLKSSGLCYNQNNILGSNVCSGSSNLVPNSGFPFTSNQGSLSNNQNNVKTLCNNPNNTGLFTNNHVCNQLPSSNNIVDHGFYNMNIPTPLDFYDPYGLSRLTCLYSNIHSFSFLYGNLSPFVPSAFAFPASGVILPSQYRRYKSAALAQIWQTLSEVPTNYCRQLLPALTPKRNSKFKKVMQSSVSGLGADYGWSEENLSDVLYSQNLTPQHVANVNSRRSLNKSAENSVFRRQSCKEFNSPLYSSSELKATNYDTNFSNNYSKQRTSLGLGVQKKSQNYCKIGDQYEMCFSANQPESNLTTPRVRNTIDIDSDYSQAPIPPSWLNRSITSRLQVLDDNLYPINQSKSRWSLTPNINRASGLSDAKLFYNLSPSSKMNLLNLRKSTNSYPTSCIGNEKFKDKLIDLLAPKCTREGYSTKPSIEALESYSESRLAIVEDFTVIREGFGEITWPGFTDVRKLSIDDIVMIEDKAVEVYPESTQDIVFVPPVGIGLNKPALITLHNCKPKELHHPVADGSKEAQEEYNDHVRRMKKYTEQIGGHFISLSPQWVWKFRVDHFSRYAFPDFLMEDESCYTINASKKKESQRNFPYIRKSSLLDARLVASRQSSSFLKQKFEPLYTVNEQFSSNKLNDITSQDNLKNSNNLKKKNEENKYSTSSIDCEFLAIFMSNRKDKGGSIDALQFFNRIMKSALYEKTLHIPCFDICVYSKPVISANGLLISSCISRTDYNYCSYSVSLKHLSKMNLFNPNYIKKFSDSMSTMKHDLVESCITLFYGYMKLENQVELDNLRICNNIMLSLISVLNREMEKQSDSDNHSKNDISHLYYIISTLKLVNILFGSLYSYSNETSIQDYTELFKGANIRKCFHDDRQKCNLNDSFESLSIRERGVNDQISSSEILLSNQRLSEIRCRLKNLSNWIAQQNMIVIQPKLDELHNKTTSSIDSDSLLLQSSLCRLKRAFHLLTANNVSSAVNELICSQHIQYNHMYRIAFIRLALSLSGGSSSSLLGSPINHEPYFRQLLEWQKKGYYDSMPVDIIRLHHLTAGCVDTLVSSESIDWKCLIGLLLWYPSPDVSLYLCKIPQNVSSNIQEQFTHCVTMESLQENLVDLNDVKLKPSLALSRALNIYISKLLQVEKQSVTPAPLPYYSVIERRPVTESDSLDIQFNIIRWFSNISNLHHFNRIFDLSSFTPYLYEVFPVWAIFKVLCIYCSYNNEYYDMNNNYDVDLTCNLSFNNTCSGSFNELEKTRISMYLDQLMTQQLLFTGLWQWAIYIIITQLKKNYIEPQTAFNKIFETYLSNIPYTLNNLESSKDENTLSFKSKTLFILQELKVPLTLILYANAINFSNGFQYRMASDQWLDLLIMVDNDNTILSSQSNISLTQINSLFTAQDNEHEILSSNLINDFITPTSIFCNVLLNLLLSSEFMNGIEMLCSYFLGSSSFLGSYRPLSMCLNKSIFTTSDGEIIDLDDTVIQNFFYEPVQKRRFLWVTHKMLRRTTLELCHDIILIAKSNSVIRSDEWSKSPCISFCLYLSWVQRYEIFMKKWSVTYEVSEKELFRLNEDNKKSVMIDLEYLQELGNSLYLLIKQQLNKLQSTISFDFPDDKKNISDLSPLYLISNKLDINSNLPAILGDVHKLPENVIKNLNFILQVLSKFLKTSLVYETFFTEYKSITNDSLESVGYGVFTALNIF